MNQKSGSAAIEIVEVGPRDGLQNEPLTIATADKIALIERAIAFGARRIEVASFVHPGKVPQMADAEAVVAGLPRRGDVTYIGLALNVRGAERALAAGVDEIGAVCVSTDSFATRNQGQSSAESIAIARDLVALANAAGRSASITIGAAFGCPFEGDVPAAHIVDMALRAADSGAREIVLADTIGVGTPAQVTQLVQLVAPAIAPTPLRVHFHNTRNTGIANVWAAVSSGVTTVDASLGGLGGCPFAPGASGNVPTEDVLYMLERSGIPTGLDLERAIAASAWLSDIMGKALPAALGRAGIFPKKASAAGVQAG